MQTLANESTASPPRPASRATHRAPRERAVWLNLLARCYAAWERWSGRGTRSQPVFFLLLCCLFGVRALLSHAPEALGGYDEGLLFTDAYLMDQGREIYRDFYVNYPPGILQIVRAINALSSTPIWSVRLMGLLVRLASAVLAGWLVGRARRENICLATVAVILILQANIGLVLYAYSVAVLMILAGIPLWSQASVSNWHAAAGGVLLGLISYVRHDLFVYGVLVFAPIEAVSCFVRRRSFFAGSLRRLAVLVGAAGVTIAVLWAPHILASGVSRIVHDIALDQARLTMPGRMLPLPPFAGNAYSAWLAAWLPTWITNHLTGGLLIAAAATVATLLLLPLRWIAEPAGARGVRIALLLCGFALATLPQALQRTDYPHVVFGSPLMVSALFVLLGRRIATVPVLVLVLTPWFVVPQAFIGFDQLERLWRERSNTAYVPADRQQLAQYIAGQTLPGEPIFVGCMSHTRLVVNALDVYYLARRPGATRYMQFDPGTVTGVQGQTEMIADLERNRPRLALRFPSCYWYEPNTSQFEGAGLLDAYLAQHYSPEGAVGGFYVWRRRAEP